MLSPRTWKTPTIDVFRVNIYLKKKFYHSICKDCTEAASASSLQLSHPKVPRLAVCPMGPPFFLWVPPALPLQPPLPSRSLHSCPADGSGDGAPLQVPHCPSACWGSRRHFGSRTTCMARGWLRQSGIEWCQSRAGWFTAPSPALPSAPASGLPCPAPSPAHIPAPGFAPMGSRSPRATALPASRGIFSAALLSRSCLGHQGSCSEPPSFGLLSSELLKCRMACTVLEEPQ